MILLIIGLIWIIGGGYVIFLTIYFTVITDGDPASMSGTIFGAGLVGLLGIITVKESYRRIIEKNQNPK